MDFKTIDTALLKQMFKQSNEELKRNVELVNDLNVFPVPDGDTGTNMSLTMQSAIESIDPSKDYTIETLSKEVSKGSLMGARGNSGVILSQIFRGFAKGCEEKNELTPKDFAEAISEASKVAYSAVMKPVEGTILTVIRKTGEQLERFVTKNTTVDEAVEYAIHVAKKALEETPEELEVLKQAGVVDAGGKGLVCILIGFDHAIKGKELLNEEIESITKKSEARIKAPENIEFGYCTEFILRGTVDAEGLKKKIEKLGDSMVFVQSDDIIKIHVHTNNPGIALEYGLEEGELVKIKIENMREQHSHIINGEEKPKPKVEKEKSKYEIISVAIGSGISEIFRDLGVTQIIEGGQTMNPSTKDLLEKIDDTNAENIIILPNNSNIILAAEQAKKLSDKNVYILPTKSIPQGINSLIEFNWDDDVEINLERMNEGIEKVKTVQVTYSVKDTTFDDVEIKKDEILGVSDGNIVSVGDDLHDITMKTVKTAIDEDTEIVTIYFGKDVEEEVANNLASEIEELLEFGDVEVYYGGQPLYYYLISIE
ncbi:MAG TPA: DAK2 domain-containing protein [Clostridia bacterium]|nr:DAK2 domain-containing protein [Clostridia bacterium]